MRAHVATWPDDIAREAPLAWIWRHMQWGACPQVELCNSLRIPTLDSTGGASKRERVDHFSIRVFGLSAREVFLGMFVPESGGYTSLDEFVDANSGTHIHTPDLGETLLTYDHRHAYRWRWSRGWVQRTFPDHLLQTYVCNEHGDFAYMTLSKGGVDLYQEDLRSPLPLEVRVHDGSGSDPRFLVEEDPDAQTLERLRAIKRLLEEAGVEAHEALQLSRVSAWFDGAPPDPHANPSARDRELLRCIGNTRPQRHDPTSRGQLDDPLDDDDIPF